MAMFSETHVTQRSETASRSTISFEKQYSKAVEDKILPGYALLAGDKTGRILYSKTEGVASLKDPSQAPPFQLDTICSLASMTKLLTSVACLQAVELGFLKLDEDVSGVLPEIGKYGILKSWDEAKNEGVFEDFKTPITLRMLLTHTSGHEYDWFNPLLAKWRASRNEAPWSGPSIVSKSTLPLLFEPGTSFRYSGGPDWAGLMIHRTSGQNLDAFIRTRILDPLDVKDITFFPKEREDMKTRLADLCTLSETGEGPATHSDFDLLFGGTECLGGGGASASPEAYFKVLQAIFCRDSRILKEESYEELFRPQLDERCKTALNEYLYSSPAHSQYLGMSLPKEIQKTWCLAGLICETGQEGRMGAGTTFWGGVPSMQWFMDHKAGICGVAFCQLLPPMFPAVLSLHEEFQKTMFEEYGSGK